MINRHRGNNILHIITGLATGGVERAFYNLFGLAERFNRHIISLRDEETMAQQIRALGKRGGCCQVRGHVFQSGGLMAVFQYPKRDCLLGIL